MKKTNIAKAINNFGQTKIFGKSRPIQVSLAITNRCNFNCVYCYGDYFHRKDKDLSLKEIIKLARFLKKRGTFQIYLTGGEPLLRKDVNDLVRKLKKLGFTLGMVTNGSLIDKRLETLKNIDNVIVSIDGRKKPNDANRGKGTYEKTISNIELLWRNNIKFSIKVVFNKNNINELDYLVDLASRYGTVLETVIPYENSESDLYLSEKQKKELLKKIEWYKEEGKPIMFNLSTHRFSNHIYEKFKEPIVFRKTNYPDCMCGKLYAFIDANGDVYPCNQLISRFEPKNIKKHGLKAAFNHATKRNCSVCCIPFLNEKRLLFSLNPKIILEKIR